MLLLGGSVGLLRWLDAWIPWGGLERTYRGFLLATLAAVLPELVVAATALGLKGPLMAEGVMASSVLWRLGSCGLLAMVLPPGRNPLLPGRNLANLLPAVAVVMAILAFVAALFRLPNQADPVRKVMAGAMVLVPYLGCLWLVWRSALESKNKPPWGPETDLIGLPGPRPGAWSALGTILAIAAGGAMLAWATHNSLEMLKAAHGSESGWRSYLQHVFLFLGAFLALPGVVQAWHDRRREATSLRPTRELLAGPTLLVVMELVRYGSSERADTLWSLAIMGTLAAGALAVLFASVERFIPVQVRGLAMFLTGLGMLLLAWRI